MSRTLLNDFLASTFRHTDVFMQVMHSCGLHSVRRHLQYFRDESVGEILQEPHGGKRRDYKLSDLQIVLPSRDHLPRHEDQENSWYRVAFQVM